MENGQNGVLMDIGEVAARNIALGLNLEESHVSTIKNAIRDEITALGSHFTLAVSQLQTQYELDLAKIKSEWTFVKANKLQVGLVAAAVFAAGLIVGCVV